jgi:hypothetical protein
MTYFVEGLTHVPGGESKVRRVGEFATLEEAIGAAQKLIDDFLQAKWVAGMTVAALYEQYQEGGEVPFIFSDDARTMNVSGFNHFNYAATRCGALCAPAESGHKS